MEKNRLVKRILVASDVRMRGRPLMGWMDGLKRVLNERGMFMQQGRMIVCDRSEWMNA